MSAYTERAAWMLIVSGTLGWLGWLGWLAKVAILVEADKAAIAETDKGLSKWAFG